MIVLDPGYGTCGEANAHGYGPYRRGVDPEYAWYQAATAWTASADAEADAAYEPSSLMDAGGCLAWVAEHPTFAAVLVDPVELLELHL